MERKRSYQVGAYLRLSREDAAAGDGEGSRKAESNSISSQRELIRAYIERQDDMVIYDSYVDDGFSGASFERPGFRRLMEDIGGGRVNCVVVKDLSRFGRDYIEAGRLLQKTFPALGVRFVAVTDHFDSLTADYNETSLVLPVKNFVNDSYCRDISGKVKSHQRVKRERGEFIGAFAVYGYRKAAANKNRLIPDDYPAQIVRDIFAWKLEGMSCHAIAMRLNELGTLSPMEYKQSTGSNYMTGFQEGGKASWSSAAVKRILCNEMYTGMLVQGKSERISYKVKKCLKKPTEEWVRVPDSQEAIVVKEDFELAQRLLAVDSRASGQDGRPQLFNGLLFCAGCGRPMIRRVSRYHGKERISFICPTRNRGEGCTRHTIEEAELKRVILQELQIQAAVLVNRKRVYSGLEGIRLQANAARLFEQEIARLAEAAERYESLKGGLYEDIKSGIITQEDAVVYRRLFDERQGRMREQIAKQKEALRAFSRDCEAREARLKRFREEPGITELNRGVLLAFVDRIQVYEDKRICLHVKYRDEFGSRGADAQAGQD